MTRAIKTDEYLKFYYYNPLPPHTQIFNLSICYATTFTDIPVSRFIEGVTTVEFLGQANGIFGNKKWNLMEFLELEFSELNGNGRVKYDIDDLF